MRGASYTKARPKPFLWFGAFLSLAVLAYCLFLNPRFSQMGTWLYGARSDNLLALALASSQGAQFAPLSQEQIPNRPVLLFPQALLLRPLASVVGPVLAFNLLSLVSFLLSGTAVYVLLRLLSLEPPVAIVCGLAYMVLPIHAELAQYHLSLSQVEVLPLFLCGLVLFLRRPTGPAVSLILVAQAAAFLVDAHYGLFCFGLLVVFLLTRILMHVATRQGFRTVVRDTLTGLVLVSLAGVCGLPRLLTLNATGAEVSLGKPSSQLVEYSARPWDYILPPAQNPLLGRFSSGFIQSHLHNSFLHEQTLYVGWVMLVLAIWGFLKLRRAEDQERRFLGFFLPLAGSAAFLFSLPPIVDLAGVRVPMPSSLLGWFFPMFRVYARLGVVVGLLVIILGGFGLSGLLARSRKRTFLALGVGALVLLECWTMPQSIDLSRPPSVYAWIRQDAEVGAIAEYPLCFPPQKIGDHLNLWDLYERMFWQTVHGKAFFGGTPTQATALAMQVQLADPSNPGTPVRLRWLGVTHLVCHRGQVGTDTLEALLQHPNLSTVYSDDTAIVFRITGNSIYLPPVSFRWFAAAASPEASSNLGSCIPKGEELLIYGPYIAIPSGTYNVRFDVTFASQRSPNVHILVTADSGRTTLAEGELSGSAGDKRDLVFSVPDTASLEFRVYGMTGAVEFGGVVLSNIGKP